MLFKNLRSGTAHSVEDTDSRSEEREELSHVSDKESPTGNIESLHKNDHNESNSTRRRKNADN